MISLVILGAAFAFAVFSPGINRVRDWNLALLGVGAASAWYWLRTPRAALAPPLEWWLKWPLLLLVGYAGLQLVPLPLWALDALSPARAQSVRDLEPLAGPIRYAPLSVAPTATLAFLLRLAAYAAVFFLVRELSWRFRERPWRLAAAIVVVATAQAVLGLAQHFLDPSGVASGTYANRNNFAGLLEMALPFALMGAAAVLEQEGRQERSALAPVLWACVLLASAAVMLAAIVFSSSRMGFLAGLFGLMVTGVLAAGASLKRRSRKLAGAAVTAAVVLAFVFLPTDALIARFAELAATEEVSADTRVQIWQQTQGPIRAFPLVGCGLGGYESAFEKYQQVAVHSAVLHAENDYLQGLAEVGWAGAVIVVALIAGVGVKARQALGTRRRGSRHLVVACAGALAALGLHSLVECSLYQQVNALAAAWIGGMVAGIAPVES